MTAIDRLDAWLRISPSTVLPAEVLEYLDDVKAENAKLHELAKKLKACNSSCNRCIELYGICEHETELREFGIEVE